MDPDQLAALSAAAGAVLAAVGIRHRKGSRSAGPRLTLGLALARVGTGAARVAGNVTGATGRVAAGTTAAGIRVGGATVAHSAGLVVDGVTGVGVGMSRAGWSVLQRAGRLSPMYRGTARAATAPATGAQPAAGPGTKAKAAGAPVTRARSATKATAPATRAQPATASATRAQRAAKPATRAKAAKRPAAKAPAKTTRGDAGGLGRRS